MRTSIIGYSGSGKTTFAQELSKRFSLPYLHLDRLWFEFGGNDMRTKSPDEMLLAKEQIREKIKNKVITFIAQDAWVSDGLYSHSQTEIAKHATTILFLDIPLWKRILNHLVRTFRRTNRHPELTLFDDLCFTYELIKRT